MTESPTEDNKRVSEDSKYSQAHLYCNMVLGKYEVMPSLTYLTYLGDDADVEVNSTAMSLTLKKRFEYPSFWD
jgi:hypothetical protein